MSTYNKRLDEYQPYDFYEKHSGNVRDGFSSFEVEGVPYFAFFKNGALSLISQSYKSAAGRDNGIKSTKKNMMIEGHYRFKSYEGGGDYFGIVAGNRQEVAVSVPYKGEGAARRAAAAILGRSIAPKTSAAPKTSKTSKTTRTTKTTKAAKVSKAAKAPKVSNNEDNYRPLAFYERQTKGTPKNGIERFKGDDGSWYFVWNERGKVALISEGYPNVNSRETGAASVEKNIKIEKRFKTAKMKNGKHELRLHAGNHKEIARGVWYGSAAAAATGMAYLLGTKKASAPKAKPVAKPKPKPKPVVKPKAVAKPKPVATKPKPVAKPKPKAAPIAAAAAIGAAGLAAGTAKPKKAAPRDDDYLKCEEYHNRTVTDKANNIALFEHKNGLYYFVAYDNKGDVRLRSEGFEDTASRNNELSAVLRLINKKDYYKKIEKNGYVMDVLYDESGREVGRSCLRKIAAPVAAVAAGGVAAAAVAATTGAAAVKGAAAPVAAVAAAPAAAGGLGWLKWLLPLLLLLLLGLFGLSKCKSPDITVPTVTAPSVPAVQAPPLMTAPLAPAPAPIPEPAPAPTPPAPAPAPIVESAPVAPAPAPTPPPAPVPTPRSTGLNICSSSDIGIFNVPTYQTPKPLEVLGTNPEFGNSHGLTPAQFQNKLADRAANNGYDRSYLNYVARSIGYSNFAAIPTSAFSNDVIPQGTSGLLGYSQAHAYGYFSLPNSEIDRQAFRIEGANGQIIHFMKTCGNYFYGCN